MTDYVVEGAITEIRKAVGRDVAIRAVSVGVDSSTVTARVKGEPVTLRK